MLKKYFYIFLLLLILSYSSQAWWSVEIYNGLPKASTHRKLTAKAIDQIKNIQNDTAKCPDIERFGNQIIEWTTYPGNDENTHGKKYEAQYGVKAGDYNGGPYEWWWNKPDPNPEKADGILVKYKQRRFIDNLANDDYAAYYYLAMMAHLIADQAVPAHAANIAHAFPSSDNLEGVSYWDSPEEGGTQIMPGIAHYYYFYELGTTYGSIFDTQSKIPIWKNSLLNCNFWLENPNKKYKGELFDSTWGYYGYSSTDVYTKLCNTQDIIPTQFLQSVGYMTGFLRTVSEKLPPLVSGLALTSNTILENSSTTIKFQVDENRQPNVRISLLVDNKPIKATDIVWNSAEKVLQPNDEDDQLPYRGQFSIDWDGRFVDGTYPTDGQHELVLRVQDTDGNWSDSSAVSFTIDRNPTEVSIDTTPPEVVNAFPDNSILNRKNTSMSATLGDIGSGVDTTSVKIELDGVLKDVGIQVFGGGAIGIYYSAENLAEGTRRWKVIGRDLAGNQINDTEHTFKVDTIKPKVKSFSIGGKAFKIK